MHRLLVTSDQLVSDAPALSREAQNHLKVLRPKDGETVELFDGQGAWRVCRYVASDRSLRPDGDIRRLAAPCQALTLFACVTKGSRWDWTIEKATELGVTRIVPVLSARTIVRVGATEREAKRERWQRIAEEAARQSDAKWLPAVLAPVPFDDSLPLVRETRCFVGALTNPPPPTIGTALRNLTRLPSSPPSVSDSSFSVYVGPEGDFTPEELSALLEIATPVSFGATVLRAETAAVYGISALKAFLDVRLG